MLYYLSQLSGDLSVLNLFRYLTFRAGGAILTALLVAFLIGPGVIRWLKRKQKEGQPIRAEGPESHLLTKKGTPTMGGMMILIGCLVSTLLWADLGNGFVWAVLLVTLSYGLLGMADDLLKVTKRNTKGVPGKVKLLVQFGVGAIATAWIVRLSDPAIADGLSIPFFKTVMLHLGLFYIPFGMFVMVGASNAVNLTDGLDGLATVPVMIAAGVFALIAYFVGSAVYSNYLGIHYVPGTGELAVFLAALIGACLGFLWFNAPPAMVFMGDTGSLALGGALGAVAVATRHEIVLAITGGLFVLETVSVIVQVASFKLTGKRVFRMAPLHHHFEKKGWAEPTIVIRFWIIATILAIVGLSTLKLR
ncbi:phospho-N-acetylmuramoyl-pentapeptide-transferase [Novispirillum itersonii]|uniref:Phospho-N-acetylmuramoyl-pentapeptide-transferase n=1 Tax=Novispirillum itersonii TaxID=189 RepID=A0A7X0DL19_NOVIT|nr:phospho-N-acetylmuramoyl-pentapeptide-transferase [Novispirillum itersonii]MBB6209520.1 phospho-N-acetylmuramoyl-pentapeptide-transferase [Novispirillum itersonii]